jgi:class 3 adenylate cyclase
MSSFELTLKDVVPELKSLKLAIGIDMGTTIASRLGDYGQRDRICIGEATYNAAAIQEQCTGDEVGISKAVFNAVRPAWQKLFKWDDRGFYVGKALRADDLEYADAKRDFGKDGS